MRQRPLLALVAVAVLLAGACASGDSSSHTAAAGGTVSGKVVFTDSTVTLGTVGGERAIALTAATEGRDNLVVGSEVTIELQGRSTGGDSVAVRIRPPSTAPRPGRCDQALLATRVRRPSSGSGGVLL